MGCMVVLQLHSQREEGVRKKDEASGWASSSPSLQPKQLCFFSDLNTGIKEGVILNYYYFEEIVLRHGDFQHQLNLSYSRDAEYQDTGLSRHHISLLAFFFKELSVFFLFFLIATPP